MLRPIPLLVRSISYHTGLVFRLVDIGDQSDEFISESSKANDWDVVMPYLDVIDIRYVPILKLSTVALQPVASADMKWMKRDDHLDEASQNIEKDSNVDQAVEPEPEITVSKT